MVSNLSGVEEESKSSSLQPWLLMSDVRENCRIQTNMFSNNKPQLLYDVGGEIPEFLGRDIGCSFHEWVLLTRSFYRKLPEVLVNLLSKEVIELPFVEFKYDFCTLTSHPYDPTCHIVYFRREEKALIFCQPGDKEFTIQKWDYKFFPCGARAAVAGKLFLTIEYSSAFSVLGVIEFKESTYRFEVIRMDRGIIPIATEDPLFFEYSGELCIVYRIRWGIFPYSPLSGFEILKVDFLNKKWVTVKSLGTNAIFIGNDRYGNVHVQQCASIESGANSIYFFEPYDHDSYYIYNLEDGTIRMKLIFSSMEMETTKYWQLNWIMMPCEASFRKLLKGDQESVCQDSEKDNKASVEVEEVGVKNSWNMVPPELLNLIQLHLFGRYNAVFRVVCKAWQQVSSIQDYSIPSIPALLSSTTLLELCQSSSPLLMFQEDITISDDSVPIFRFFDPVHRKLYRTEIQELRETDIHYSRDGWLLVSRRSDESIFFFNPLTQEKIELPRMPSFFDEKAYSLSFSCVPTCSNCLVVGVAHFAMFYTLKHGEETWREPERGEFRGLYEPYPVVLNGLYHFMRDNRDMVVFDFKDGGVEGQLPYCQTWSTKFEILRMENFFLEIDGALAFVSVSRDGGDVSIFKWNDLKTDWELMKGGDDFGGKEMFLSRRGSFLEKIDGGMGNSIFLPMIDHDAKEGVFYSLATHKYHTFYSGYSSKLPYNVDRFLNGIWIKPDRKIVSDSNLKWFM